MTAAPRLAVLWLLGALAALPSPAVAEEHCPQPDRSSYGYRLAYDASGMLLPSCANVLVAILAAAPAASDIIVFSHGWRNDPVTAEASYRRFISGMLARRPPDLHLGFQPLLVGLYWPSAFFPISHEEEESLARAPLDTQASMEAKIRATFEWLGQVPGAGADVRDVARLTLLEIKGERRTRADFILLANILKRWAFFAGETGPAAATVEAPGERPLFHLEPGLLAQFLLDNSYAGTGRESFVSRLPSVLSVLNTFTFWQMKRRAGEVGESGGYELVRRLRLANPSTRVHLIGHSFGGKLVLAAVRGRLTDPPNAVDSVVVIQGALSHFALSLRERLEDLGITEGDLKEGRYAGVTAARAVNGPVIVVYSKLDLANGVWYPLGVRISGDALERRERRPPIYGAMGAHGALRVESQRLTLRRGEAPRLGRPSQFAIYNVDATEVVPGHSKFFATELYDLIWSILK